MKYYLDALKKYADFDGRARRKEFWMFNLFNMIFLYGLLGISLAFKVDWMVFLVVIYVLATLIPSIALQIRRMHDIGKSGWYSMIPYYNLYLFCLDSHRGTNQYGTSPKYGNDEISEIGQTQD